jgi:hypothetical protein
MLAGGMIWLCNAVWEWLLFKPSCVVLASVPGWGFAE